MKKIVITCLSIAFLGMISCKDEKKDTDDVSSEMKEDTTEMVKEDKAMSPKSVSFNLESKSDSKATGKVSFTEENGNVTMEATLVGLSSGTHAIHIHEKADCTSADGKSSGGHWNPTFEDHGKWGDANGFHRGDIGNFEANDTGEGTVSITTDLWCIGCGDEKKDILGKAIIVHQGVDDFTSQPSGDAGARVSCGGIIE
ncbi:superoxide dismutase family protein [Rasiella sp. SM2506]|uniref:superoxide dismutase family protein n=1 Tax=Rasiella sp. SM2506 TaxID=3423914 RepID=UPI003D7B7FCA